jgi:phosphate:Na+ symporter
MLLALHLMVETKAPVEASPTLRAVLAAISDPPLVNLLLAGLIAWAAHSSVAGVLFIASVAGSGVAAPEAALAMVLGANVGSAINPLLQASGGDPEDRAKLRLPLGNLMNRIIGALLVLAALTQATTLLQALDPTPVRLVANAHLAFNLAAAVLAFPLLSPAAALLRRLLPDRAVAPGEGTPRYLDPAALSTPAVAVFLQEDAGAARALVLGKEALRAEERAAARRLAETDGLPAAEGVASAGLLLDAVRDLRRVGAHLAAVAHSLLERRGELLPSRLATGAARG